MIDSDRDGPDAALVEGDAPRDDSAGEEPAGEEPTGGKSAGGDTEDRARARREQLDDRQAAAGDGLGAATQGKQSGVNVTDTDTDSADGEDATG